MSSPALTSYLSPSLCGTHSFSIWHISSLVASGAIQWWQEGKRKLRRKLKMGAGAGGGRDLVQKPELPKGKENMLLPEIFIIVQETLGANVAVEFGIWSSSQIDRGAFVTD